METMLQLLKICAKGLALLLGIALLIGGGLCSISVPFMGMMAGNKESETVLILVAIGVLILYCALFFWAKKTEVSQQIKSLSLTIGGLFVGGGGLCFTNSPALAMSGFILLYSAAMLSGYVLVRWLLAKKNHTLS